MKLFSLRATTVFLLVLAISPLCINARFTSAQTATLADTINNVITQIQTTDSPWTATYSQIFGLRNQSVYD